MDTVRLTMAQALVRWLVAQRTEIDGELQPVFPGVFAIFGHGNVTGLGEALAGARDRLPVWRGQNEQSMAMAGVAFAKARRRRQVMVATSSIGPGASNMVTAAGIAMANRLPLLLLSGDVFASRLPDPVLQQVEDFTNPSTTVNDAFRPVVRYWDRITRPEQLLGTLPQALSTMLDPAECGPAFLGLPQDVQSEAWDYPCSYFAPRTWHLRRPVPDPREVTAAAQALSSAECPLVIAGGGVHYSKAEEELRDFATAHDLPVAETVAGRGCLTWDHPNYVGPIGVAGSPPANQLAAEADVVVAIGTRLQDFTTGSWTVFGRDELRIVAINTARADAHKHGALPVIGDARTTLRALGEALGGHRAPAGVLARSRDRMADWNASIEVQTRPGPGLPSYAQVIGAINQESEPGDYLLTASGGFPGELNMAWRNRELGNIDIEYGFSCMGYEVGGAWGASMALPDQQVISLVGDGSWLMSSSAVYSSVLADHKAIFVLCDNGGYAVIDRLQRGTGIPAFNNMLDGSGPNGQVRVDFVAHARAMGAVAERVDDLDDLPAALKRARASDRTHVLVIETHPDAWLDGGAWWEVGVPEVSELDGVQQARADHERVKARQRRGV